jgi:undecaprenyl-diphosphatase
MSLLGAFIIGCFQAFAILPGISRSGSTILGGRLMGLRTDDAVTFSFLLAIPAILGATVLEVKDLMEDVQAGKTLDYPISELAIGAIVAFVVGILALKWLIGWSRQERLHWFAAWCIPAGIAVLFFCYRGTI